MINFNSSRCTVIVDNGTTLVMAPSGEILGSLISATLEDNYKEVPCVTIKLYCNVVGSELEANQRYKAAKLKTAIDELKRQTTRMVFQPKIGDHVSWIEVLPPGNAVERLTGRVVGYGTVESNGLVWDYDVTMDGSKGSVVRLQRDMMRVIE